MYVIDVLIISTKARPPEPLSYRSKTRFNIGDIVLVSVRKTLHTALVIASFHPQEIKERLRSASFSLKKIESETKISNIPEKVILSLLKHQSTSLASPAQYLGATISNHVIHGLVQYADKTLQQSLHPKTKQKATYFYGNRSFQINSIVKTLVKNHDTFFTITCPNRHAVDWVQQGLQKTKMPHEYIYSKRHVATQKRIISQALTNNLGCKHLITTPNFALLSEFTNQNIIIFQDDPQSYIHPFYKCLNTKTPWLDVWSDQNRIHAVTKTIPTISGTILAEEQKINTVYQKTKTPTFVFFNKDIREKVIKKDNQLFHPFVQKTIAQHLKKHPIARIFLHVTKGAHSYKTTCKDCGAIKKCSICNTNIVSATLPAARAWCSKLKSHLLKNVDICSNCGGQRLFSQTISHQTITKWVADMFENIPCLSIRPNISITQKEESILKKRIQNMGGGIIIGSQRMLLLAQPKQNDLTIATSLDSFAGSPHPRAQHKAKGLVYTLTTFCDTAPLIIHSRLFAEHLFIKALKQNKKDWSQKQTTLAKALGLAPFASHIYITYPNHVAHQEITAIQNAITHATNKNTQTEASHMSNKTILKSSESIFKMINPHLQILLQNYQKNGFKIEIFEKN